ncbi:presenilin-associated rhomboid-like protein, mitochondrial [Halyomorpha halys]|uniref:presenilin-associated rhomboid-like protein, mitochondrial n=1 Tax=Halyomorpha halys TaxID=286706 RepID=UPI0006D4FF26|nr:presenilins-associated rhomboid-like protein, mitochondrial [Halyomorpha halys]XP_014283169.1 presenilins-associated rhomboid-like protein, mitochondrial [Halyomorpha halys]
MIYTKTLLTCQHSLLKWSGNNLSRNARFTFQKFSTSSLKEVRSKVQGVKRKLDSFEPQIDGLIIETSCLDGSKLWKPFIFTAVFSTTSLATAAIWEFESIHRKRRQLKDWFHHSRRKYRNDINKWWNSLTEGEKIFAPICFINILVFLLWKIPSFHPVMVKYFCSNPGGKNICWPMVLSTFSHYSAMHIFANMYVLHSFSSGCVSNMGKEQFLGFYLAAGAIASFASYVHKVLINRPGLSLGASGAIMGVLGYCCTRFPDLELNIIFLPFFVFKASAAIKFIMGIDALGILLGWRFFDHAAHLGGALFGVFWSAYGSTYIWNKRGPIVEAWYKFRKATFSD